MKKFQSLAEILQFAISLEEMSFNFYTDLSKLAKSDSMKTVFLKFAEEERLHKERLMQIIGLTESIPLDKVDSEEISKYVSAIPHPEDMTYEQAVKTAINKEHAAMMLYQILARTTEQKQFREVLELLAVEESRHKRRFENEYRDITLKKN